MKRKYLFALLCFFLVKNLLEITQDAPLDTIVQDWIAPDEQAKRKQLYEENNGISTPGLNTELQKIVAQQTTPVMLEGLGGQIYTTNEIAATKMGIVSNTGTLSYPTQGSVYSVKSGDRNEMLAYSGGVGSSQSSVDMASMNGINMTSIAGINGGMNSGTSIESFSTSLSGAIGAMEAVAVNSPGGPGSGEGGEDSGPPDDVIPIDGGLSVLLAAALGKGASTYRRRKKQQKIPSNMVIS
ncbi:MAG: hypothetical protein ACOVNY_02070 [Chitinophagaceae bacterium]|jgi:hypothetical protein